MPQPSEICEHIEFSALVPDDGRPPVCAEGHNWDFACMKHNPCPDYEPSIVVSWEEVNRLGIQV